MFKEINFAGAQVLNREQLKKVSGGNFCSPGQHYYSYGGYEGCCAFPIGIWENPCDRVDCDVACGQCSECS